MIPRFVLLVLCLLSGTSFAQKSKFAELVGKPYTYKSSGGQERQMEVYLPPNHKPDAKQKVPGMILFHGGAWEGGDLSGFRGACAYFASRGLVCATANYQMLTRADREQLKPGESFKRVCVTDAKSAIRWFKQHADEFGMDPDRIITGGSSAGAHVSALATMNPGLNDPADPKDIDTRVVAYIWFNPAFSRNDSRNPEIDILTHLKADLPPTLVFFGNKDNWKVGWDLAHSKWKSLGTRSIDLQIAPELGHGFYNKDPWWALTLIAADEFLVKQGLLSGNPTLSAPITDQKLNVAP